MDKIAATFNAFANGPPDARTRAQLGLDEEFKDDTPLEELAFGGEALSETAIEWVWPGRIPVGFLTAIVGPKGVGKSVMLADLAARVTLGIPWPDDPFKEMRAPDPRSVLYITAEGSLENMLVRRLKNARADMARIKLIAYPRSNLEQRRSQRAKQIERWRLVAKKVADLRLIIIDGLVPLLGTANDRRNRELEEFLGQLADLAEKQDVAIVIANTSDKLGSGKSWSSGVDVVAHLREHAPMVWEIDADREGTRHKFLLPVQVGIDDDPGGLMFKVHPEHGCVLWHAEPVRIYAGSRPRSAAQKESQVTRAVRWLYQFLTLANGPVPSAKVLIAGAEENFGRSALYDAKEKLHVVSKKLTGAPNLGWEWVLPLPDEILRAESAPSDDAPKFSNVGRVWRRGLEQDAQLASDTERRKQHETFEDSKITPHLVEADSPVCPQSQESVGRPEDTPPREDEDSKIRSLPKRSPAEIRGEPAAAGRPEWFDNVVGRSDDPRMKKPAPPSASLVRPKPQHILDLEERMRDAGMTEVYLWGGPADFPAQEMATPPPVSAEPDGSEMGQGP